MDFASDNVAACHPALMSALAAANEGAARPYGADPWTERLEARVSELFERPARVRLVATGTAANALTLACMTPPWSAVFCHEQAHIEQDECGAPEFYTGGAKLVRLPGDGAKIDPEALERALASAGGAVHHVQRGALSITQASELGAVYAPEEVARLCRLARGHGVPVHMDGTRFANAVARLGCAPADLTWRAGVDALCLGATKNGGIAAEAVLMFEGGALWDKAWEFELRRKRGGHLWSKSRFLAAQMLAMLEDGLWLRLAGHANAMADRLAAGLAALPGATLSGPAAANMLFPTLPRRAHRALRAAGATYYDWPDDPTPDGAGDEPVGCRLVCSWATTPEQVDRFVDAARGALARAG
jgi:threonine aldolase